VIRLLMQSGTEEPPDLVRFYAQLRVTRKFITFRVQTTVSRSDCQSLRKPVAQPEKMARDAVLPMAYSARADPDPSKRPGGGVRKTGKRKSGGGYRGLGPAAVVDGHTLRPGKEVRGCSRKVEAAR